MIKLPADIYDRRTPRCGMIKLPADIYDALELSALVYGGIGGGASQDRDMIPLCLFGLIAAADASGEAAFEATAAGLTSGMNDSLFSSREIEDSVRISWEEYCRRGTVVRVPNEWEDEALA